MLAILTIIPYHIETNLNAFIWKSTNFHTKIYSIFKMYIKVITFRQKSWASSLNILEIMHAEKRRYLNA